MLKQYDYIMLIKANTNLLINKNDIECFENLSRIGGSSPVPDNLAINLPVIFTWFQAANWIVT